MLVKFLSYAASVIGARRYKPMFLSLAILVCLVTGISAIVTAITNGEQNISSVQQRQKTIASPQSTSSSSSELEGLQHQPIKDSEPTPSPSQPQPNPSSGSNENKSNAAAVPPVSLDISVDNQNITLNGPTASTTVSANNPNGSSDLTWSLVAETPTNGLTGAIAESHKAKEGDTVLVRFRAENPPAGNYQFILTAKDLANNLTASKIILVTIPSD